MWENTIFYIMYFNSRIVSIGAPIDCSDDVQNFVQMRKQTS